MWAEAARSVRGEGAPENGILLWAGPRDTDTTSFKTFHRKGGFSAWGMRILVHRPEEQPLQPGDARQRGGEGPGAVVADLVGAAAQPGG